MSLFKRPSKYLRKLPTFIPIPHYLKSRKYSVLYVCTIHNWRSRDRWNCPHQSESKHWRKNIILLYLLHGPVNTNHDPYCAGSRSTFESKLLCNIIDSMKINSNSIRSIQLQLQGGVIFRNLIHSKFVLLDSIPKFTI